MRQQPSFRGPSARDAAERELKARLEAEGAAKWDALLEREGVGTSSREDAMEYRAFEPLDAVRLEAEIYFKNRLYGGDMMDDTNRGNHLRYPRILATKYKLDIHDVAPVIEDMEREISDSEADKMRNGKKYEDLKNHYLRYEREELLNALLAMQQDLWGTSSIAA